MRADPATYGEGPGQNFELAPSGPWTVGGVLAGVGCPVAVRAFLAIWVNGVVALFG